MTQTLWEESQPTLFPHQAPSSEVLIYGHLVPDLIDMFIQRQRSLRCMMSPTSLITTGRPVGRVLDWYLPAPGLMDIFSQCRRPIALVE